jgi:hypothetical protein
MTCDGAEEVVSQVKVPWGSESDRQSVRLDISFEAPANAGLRTAELVCIFTASPMQISSPAFFSFHSITRFLQHQQHLGWPPSSQVYAMLGINVLFLSAEYLFV